MEAEKVFLKICTDPFRLWVSSGFVWPAGSAAEGRALSATGTGGRCTGQFVWRQRGGNAVLRTSVGTQGVFVGQSDRGSVEALWNGGRVTPHWSGGGAAAGWWLSVWWWGLVATTTTTFRPGQECVEPSVV